MPDLDAIRNKIGGLLHIEKQFVRIFLAEFLGTAILIIIGDGSVAQMMLSRRANADFFTVNVAFAFAIAYGVYISGSVSGGHINPAVTLVMAVLGKAKFAMLPFYWAGQYLGAFFGSAILYWVYYAAINEYEKAIPKNYFPNSNLTVTAGIFATYPAGEWLGSGHGFVDQMIGTAILLLAVLALTDARNVFVPAHYTPIIIGFVVGVLGMSYGYNAGFALNPARDLGPRIFTAIAGWGWEVFSFRNYNWFWVPILGPHVGAFIGAFAYKLFVGLHWPTRPLDEAPQHEDELRHMIKRTQE